MDVTFLYAPQRLVKTITMMADGKVQKSAYPLAKNFTSETVDVGNLLELHKAIVGHATDPRKPCLLKGRNNRPLINESRRNSTSTNDKTQFIVLDPDEAPFASPEELMRAIGLKDVSYIVQYSSSYKLTNSKKLSCHIFIMLDRPVPAPALKAWLMQLNLDVPVLRNALTLSNSKAALKWSLDITSCQNDRLIYIAEPEFRGMKPPVKASERIQYVKKERDRLDIARLSERAMDTLKKESREVLNKLLTDAGLTPLKRKPTMIGEHLVQTGVGEATSYEIVDDDGEFVRLNLNGGDSAAYWHHSRDFELLHNFKGEDSVKLKEILPNYYSELKAKQKEELKRQKTLQAEQDNSPSEEGDLLLCFRDKKTGAYWNGTWNPGTKKLDLFTAKNERQCEHFMMSHGRALGDFIPIWDRIFDPTSDEIVDMDARTINLWAPTEYLKNAKVSKEPTLKKCPTIQKVLNSAIGSGPVQEHFLNWLAVLTQFRTKPRTAWVMHGTQGTGKGLLVNRILAPIFGQQHVVTRLQNEVKSDFSGFIEYALIAFIDEVEADAFDKDGMVEAKLKVYITEPTVPIRKMRTDSYSAPNFTGWLFGSNKNQPVVIPRNDRRYNVAKYQPATLEITSHEIEVLIPSEIQAFSDYLMSRKADKELAGKVLITDDRESLMALSESSVDRTANALLTGNLEVLWESMPNEKLIESLHGTNTAAVCAQAFIQFMKRAARDAYEKVPSRITRDEFGVIFQHCVGNVPTSPNKLSKYLMHHGINLVRMRVGDERAMCMDIEWKVSQDFLKDVYTPPKPQPRAAALRSVK